MTSQNKQKKWATQHPQKIEQKSLHLPRKSSGISFFIQTLNTIAIFAPNSNKMPRMIKYGMRRLRNKITLRLVEDDEHKKSDTVLISYVHCVEPWKLRKLLKFILTGREVVGTWAGLKWKGEGGREGLKKFPTPFLYCSKVVFSRAPRVTSFFMLPGIRLIEFFSSFRRDPVIFNSHVTFTKLWTKFYVFNIAGVICNRMHIFKRLLFLMSFEVGVETLKETIKKFHFFIFIQS